MPYCGRRRRVAGPKGSFPRDRSPAPLCCPSGTGIALHLPSHALGSSPLLIPCLESRGQDGGHSVPGGLEVLSDPSLTDPAPCKQLCPSHSTVAGGEQSIQTSCWQEGRRSQPAQGLPVLHQVIVDCEVLRGSFFPSPVPGAWRGAISSTLSLKGEGLASLRPLCWHNARSLSEVTKGGLWGQEVAGFLSTPRFTLALFSSFKSKPHCLFFFNTLIRNEQHMTLERL